MARVSTCAETKVKDLSQIIPEMLEAGAIDLELYRVYRGAMRAD